MDESGRNVILWGDISEENARGVVARMLYLAETDGEIKLLICSDGGDPGVAHGLYDFIRTLGRDVKTIAFGKCYSCAPVVLLAGSERVATKNTHFMLHDTELDAGGSPQHMKRTAEAEEQRTRAFIDILRDRTKRSGRFWGPRVRGKSDWYCTAHEALELGLVDRVV